MIEKRWYGIGEVAKILGIETSKIRFWETVFGDLHSKRGMVTRRDELERRFSPADVLRLKVIKALLTVKKYTIEGAKKELIELNVL